MEKFGGFMGDDKRFSTVIEWLELLGRQKGRGGKKGGVGKERARGTLSRKVLAKVKRKD